MVIIMVKAHAPAYGYEYEASIFIIIYCEYVSVMCNSLGILAIESPFDFCTGRLLVTTRKELSGNPCYM